MCKNEERKDQGANCGTESDSSGARSTRMIGQLSDENNCYREIFLRQLKESFDLAKSLCNQKRVLSIISEMKNEMVIKVSRSEQRR